ncbi:sulfite exporter TauE/SafE family protein [Stappia indica]|uniref:sulfite exporter TauE/SafE family protein n=1 Tax=Stappia indica TaxID=538381 RepID=UPI001CD48012|nr:sulfite exporter TauE/SafE family protein [Stappia indica]MCA1298225.1 sulfite exporter TauE/SafE family protein [Stappia indica]
MQDLAASLLQHLPQAPDLWLLAAAIVIAAMVRGFAGFGAAMIFMPVASTVIEPAAAAAGFLILDWLVTVPMVLGALKRCDWPTVAPVSLAAMLTVPVGAAMLAHADVLALRWSLSVIVLGAVSLLMLGWRYHGVPGRATSLGVGAVAGVLSGVAQVSGPPVVVFWAAGPQPAAIIRANLIAFFAIVSLAAFTAFVANGFYTLQVLALVAVAAPLYGLGIFLGARMFGAAHQNAYRPVAYGIILMSALTSLPALDGWLR